MASMSKKVKTDVYLDAEIKKKGSRDFQTVWIGIR